MKLQVQSMTVDRMSKQSPSTRTYISSACQACQCQPHNSYLYQALLEGIMRGDVRKEMRGSKEVYFMDEYYEGEGLTDQQGGFVRASGELEDTWTTLYQPGQRHTHCHHKNIYITGVDLSVSIKVCLALAHPEDNLLAKLMTSQVGFVAEEWCQFALNSKQSAIANRSTPSDEDMIRLQEAYDSCNKLINSTKKTCQAVLAKSSSSNSAGPGLVSSAKRAVAILQDGSMREVADMQWADKNTLTIDELKNVLKKCAKDVGTVVLLEKELKALLSVK